MFCRQKKEEEEGQENDTRYSTGYSTRHSTRYTLQHTQKYTLQNTQKYTSHDRFTESTQEPT